MVRHHSSLVHALSDNFSSFNFGYVFIRMQVCPSVSAHMEARRGYRHVWPCWASSGYWGFELTFSCLHRQLPSPSPLPQSTTYISTCPGTHYVTHVGFELWQSPPALAYKC